ncbi:MAG TPA: hypothetical protein VJQ55_18355 [Candidatus Binatia bacterium]|nr:hypothetical protein [Candidatus Binatia bacterium]
MPTEAPTLRRWAMECAAKADDPSITPAERKRLLKMREALLDLANAQDWLDGRKNMPPTQQQQQRQRKPRPNMARARRSGSGIARSRSRSS